MTNKPRSKGFSLIGVFAVIVVFVLLAAGGWYVWHKNQTDKPNKKSSTATQNGSQQMEQQTDETDDWVSVTTQAGGFSMKVPGGWKLTNYPHDYIGAMETVYKANTPAVVETSSTAYVGHLLRFRASITTLDDAGLGPQWSSPQPGLEESAQDFSIGTLQGKRYKGVFSDLQQTLYEYVFDLGNGKKLDVLYAIYGEKGEKDDVITVEKAIQTISIKN